MDGVGNTKESEVIGAVEHLVGILQLHGWQRGLEVVVSSRYRMRLVHPQLDGIQEQVAILAFSNCLLRIVIDCYIIILQFTHQQQM